MAGLRIGPLPVEGIWPTPPTPEKDNLLLPHLEYTVAQSSGVMVTVMHPILAFFSLLLLPLPAGA